MRPRLVSLAVVATLSITAVACGSDTTSTGDTSTTGNTATTTADGSTGSTDSAAAASDPTIPADCPTPDSTTDTVSEASFPEGKPTVELPAELPTELVITDLIEGTGPAAALGDTVLVRYVGVRSKDGVEFDSNFDSGSTFPVTLGSGTVIQGWEEGLIGIKAGGRRQLDIPSELAYGDTDRSEVITAGTDLTFIVDAVAIKPGPPQADPADEPTLDNPTASGATKVEFTDVVAGDRCDIALRGATAFLQVILYNGDNGDVLQSTWADGGVAIEIALDDSTIQGLVDGVIGMGVGGRRRVVIPPDLGFGTDGNLSRGLTATTDLVLLVDLVALL